MRVATNATKIVENNEKKARWPFRAAARNFEGGSHAPTAFRLLVTVALVLAPSIAFAHPGHGGDAVFWAGFIHPFGGLDHLLAMTAVGLFAAHLGGRALWAIPATFVALMALGGVSGAAGNSLPFVETAIALSVVVFGLMIFSGMAPPVLAAMALVGIFAVFQATRTASKCRSTVPGSLYGMGFMVATALAARLRHDARPFNTAVRRSAEAPRHESLRRRNWIIGTELSDRSGLIGCARRIRIPAAEQQRAAIDAAAARRFLLVAAAASRRCHQQCQHPPRLGRA